MCLSDEAREEYSRVARAMDDERLHKLDHYYRSERGRLCDTVDLELHFIVSRELENRRQERVRRLKRSLWLSSRRGRFVEAIKRWLVQWGLWSSSRRRVINPLTDEVIPMLSFLKPVFRLLWLFSGRTARASIDSEAKAQHL